MTAQTILPANTLSSGGYDVANSVRMETNTYLTGSDKVTATSNKIGSFSFWIKRSGLGANAGGIIKVYDDANTGSYIGFKDDNTFFVEETNAGGTAIVNLITNAVYRDMSAWYHILVTFKTDDGTDSNRVKLYINGTQPSLGTATYPNENTNLLILGSANPKHEVGVNAGGASGKHYLAQLLHVDGTALSNTDVGEFDEDSGIWKPIDISETTLGNNGYYLSMEDSSNFGVATGKAMTAHGFAATDSRTDTCTNNFATLNALATGLDATLSEGNLKMVSGTATTRSGTASTIGLTAGKWFAEFKITGSANGIVGIAGTTQNKSATDDDDIGNYPGRTQQGYGYLSGGSVYNDSSAVTGSFATFTTDDIIGVAVDLDGDLLYFYKNGAIQNSGTGIDISGITPHSGSWFFAVGDGSAGTASTVECNFGNPITALSSAVADGKGFGSFEFTPKSGHLALCTKNLGSNG